LIMTAIGIGVFIAMGQFTAAKVVNNSIAITNNTNEIQDLKIDRAIQRSDMEYIKRSIEELKQLIKEK